MTYIHKKKFIMTQDNVDKSKEEKTGRDHKRKLNQKYTELLQKKTREIPKQKVIENRWLEIWNKNQISRFELWIPYYQAFDKNRVQFRDKIADRKINDIREER